MNIISFDIEEWFIEKHFKGGRNEKYRQYNEVLEWILESLEIKDIKATFFCVGQLAKEFPEIVKKISNAGHEVGSHSNTHLWVNKMTKKEFIEDTYIAVSELENLIGKKIKSFRAPAFSVGQSNDWAFEVLAENGIEYDASVFPTCRDFGGFPQFKSSIPTIVKKNGIELKEFPICPAIIMGKMFPFSGGGYFRMTPLWIQKYFVDNMDYVMFYFHINDLLEEKGKFMSRTDYEEYFRESGTLKNRIIRYFKTNIGKGCSTRKLGILLSEYDFINVEKAAALIEWDKQPIIKL